MAADNKYLHFTIGPVQGFVAQARRTRDFWAGSFLLSWLAGVAMAEIERQHGKIDFPTPAEGYLDWIRGNPHGEAPRQGGIPNRFKAMKAEVPAEFDAELLESTVREAWFQLAEHIWINDGLVNLGAFTRAIWERQHRHFWEITWVVTPDENASDLLDRRKAWRNHSTQAEPGVKCMMMDGWQELSGAIRPGQAKNPFWEDLRGSGLTGMESDLREGEHLCGLAYVKRRFVRHFASFETTCTSKLYLKGWKLAAGIPSVSYMAAVHWLEKLVEAVSVEDLDQLAEATFAAGASRDEWNIRIRCLDALWQGRKQAEEREGRKIKREILAYDGNVFFEHIRQQPKRYDFKPSGMKQVDEQLRQLLAKHPELPKAPSPFYAVLLMDGDSLGSHMANNNQHVW